MLVIMSSAESGVMIHFCELLRFENFLACSQESQLITFLRIDVLNVGSAIRGFLSIPTGDIQ